MGIQNSVIGIVGAGAMGTGIAQVVAGTGHPVLLYDALEGKAETGKQLIADALTQLVQKQKMSAEARIAILEKITTCSSIDELLPACLVIEAAIEQLEIKQEIFTGLENLCSDETILATNTSSLSITELGACLNHPERLIGLHFFNPAPVMKLVEVVPGLCTAPHIVDCAKDYVKNWGKVPVLARSTPGFIVNRVARPFYGEAFRLLEEGIADPATLDTAMRESGGFRMGPCELMDLIGLDIGLAVTKSVWAGFHGDSRYKPSLLQEEMVAGNRLGRKTGKGFYDYDSNAEKPLPVDAPAAKSPARAVIHGESEVLTPLLSLLADTDIEVMHGPGEAGKNFVIELENCVLALTDGQPAYEVAVKMTSVVGGKGVLVFDLAFDYVKTKRIIMAPSDACSRKGIEEAAGFFQALGKQVSFIKDAPGLITGRIACMLINEAADAVYRGIGSIEDVDIAMTKGVNYPIGLLAWCDQLGPGYVASMIGNLRAVYAEERYRVSPLLRRMAVSGGKFYA